jgi:hypothetical protein
MVSDRQNQITNVIAINSIVIDMRLVNDRVLYSKNEYKEEKTPKRLFFGKMREPHLRNYECPPQHLLIRWAPHLYLDMIIP